MRCRLCNRFDSRAVFARGSAVQQSTETLPRLRCLRQTLKKKKGTQLTYTERIVQQQDKTDQVKVYFIEMNLELKFLPKFLPH